MPILRKVYTKLFFSELCYYKQFEVWLIKIKAILGFNPLYKLVYLQPGLTKEGTPWVLVHAKIIAYSQDITPETIRLHAPILDVPLQMYSVFCVFGRLTCKVTMQLAKMKIVYSDPYFNMSHSYRPNCDNLPHTKFRFYLSIFS